MTQEPRSSRLLPEKRPEEELSAQEQVLAAETGFLQRLCQSFDRLSPRQRAIAMSVFSLFLFASRAEAGIGVQPDEHSDKPSFKLETIALITPDMKKMHRLLVELQAAGYQLNFLEGYTLQGLPIRSASSAHESLHSEVGLLLTNIGYYLSKNNAAIFFTSTPGDKLDKANTIDLELPVEARDMSKPIEVPLHEIVIIKTGEEMRLTVRNWLSGRIVYESEVTDPNDLMSFDEIDAYAADVGARIQTAVREDLSTVSDQWRTVQGQVGQVEMRRPVYDFNENAEPAEDAASFFDQFTQVKFRAHAHNRPFEDINFRTFEITKDIVAHTQQRPLEIHGAVLQSIELHREVPLDTDRTPSLLIDRYGNAIQRGCYTAEHQDDNDQTVVRLFELFLIYPQQQFSEQSGDEAEVHPIQLDLTNFDLGTLKDYVYQPIERPAFSSADSAHHFYTTMDHEAVREKFGSQLEQVADRVSQLESIYGLQAGSAIRQILVLDSHLPNAFYSYANPDAIILFDEALRMEAGSFIGIHESQHRLSRLLQMNDDVALVQHHGALSADFFTAVNESSWFASELKMAAGHSSDNVSELLASFMNTLLDPDWETKIAQWSPQLRAEYVLTIDTLHQALSMRISEEGEKSAIGSLPTDAPIFQLLHDHKTYIQLLDSE